MVLKWLKMWRPTVQQVRRHLLSYGRGISRRRLGTALVLHLATTTGPFLDVYLSSLRAYVPLVKLRLLANMH